MAAFSNYGTWVGGGGGSASLTSADKIPLDEVVELALGVSNKPTLGQFASGKPFTRNTDDGHTFLVVDGVVKDITNSESALTYATTADVVVGTNETKVINPKELKISSDKKFNKKQAVQTKKQNVVVALNGDVILEDIVSETDAGEAWKENTDYKAGESFTFQTSNTTAKDIDGNDITPNKKLIGMYAVDTTSGASLTNAEMIKFQVVGVASVVKDSNLKIIVSADDVEDVAPTTIEKPTPISGDTAIKFLTNDIKEYWEFNTTWTKVKSEKIYKAPEKQILTVVNDGDNVFPLPAGWTNVSAYFEVFRGSQRLDIDNANLVIDGTNVKILDGGQSFIGLDAGDKVTIWGMDVAPIDGNYVTKAEYLVDMSKKVDIADKVTVVRSDGIADNIKIPTEKAVRDLFANISLSGTNHGAFNTYAELQTEGGVDKDIAILGTADIGNGTAEAPQYPAGIYMTNGTTYTLALKLNTDVIQLLIADMVDITSEKAGSVSGKLLYDREQNLKGTTPNFDEANADYEIAKTWDAKTLKENLPDNHGTVLGLGANGIVDLDAILANSPIMMPHKAVGGQKLTSSSTIRVVKANHTTEDVNTYDVVIGTTVDVVKNITGFMVYENGTSGLDAVNITANKTNNLSTDIPANGQRWYKTFNGTKIQTMFVVPIGNTLRVNGTGQTDNLTNVGMITATLDSDKYVVTRVGTLFDILTFDFDYVASNKGRELLVDTNSTLSHNKYSMLPATGTVDTVTIPDFPSWGGVDDEIEGYIDNMSSKEVAVIFSGTIIGAGLTTIPAGMIMFYRQTGATHITTAIVGFRKIPKGIEAKYWDSKTALGSESNLISATFAKATRVKVTWNSTAYSHASNPSIGNFIGIDVVTTGGTMVGNNILSCKSWAEPTRRVTLLPAVAVYDVPAGGTFTADFGSLFGGARRDTHDNSSITIEEI